MLYTRMRDGCESRIADFFMMTNQEQITLLANRLGWTLLEMKQWPALDANPEWFWCVMDRPKGWSF
jgi:hypothetical protein